VRTLRMLRSSGGNKEEHSLSVYISSMTCYERAAFFLSFFGGCSCEFAIDLRMAWYLIDWDEGGKGERVPIVSANTRYN